MSDNVVKSVTKDKYVKVRKARCWATRLLWASAIVLLLLAIYEISYDIKNIVPIKYIGYLKYLQISLILSYHVCIVYSSILHYQAGKLHFPDFLDNALGTCLITEHSENYYDDEEVKKGALKIAYQTAENCYFTKYIFKIMKQQQYKSFICIVIIAMLVFISGYTDFVVLFFKITLPVVMLKKTITIFYAAFEFSRLYEDIYKVMTHKSTKRQLLADALNILLQYESLKAWLNFPSSEKIYKEYNEQINKDFEKEKSNYILN